MFVSSDLASGCFEVAVCPSLPVKGVDLIMGNDIAGGKVMPVVQVIDVPCNDLQADVLAKKLPDVFSAVVTRAQVRHDFQESNILCDSVFSKILKDDILPESSDASEMTLSSSFCFDLAADLPVSWEILIEAQRNDSSLNVVRVLKMRPRRCVTNSFTGTIMCSCVSGWKIGMWCIKLWYL